MCDDRYVMYKKDHSYTLKDGSKIRPHADVAVPCGRCYQCRTTRGLQWAFRLQQELLVARTAVFATLTYNTSNVPIVYHEGRWYMSLDKNDLRLFWKRLRKLEPKFKYYVVGEYGEKRKRPHYHALIFGVQNNENINKAWNGGDVAGLAKRSEKNEVGVWREDTPERGKIHIGDVTLPSIIYCVDYMMKEKVIPEFKGDPRVLEFSNKSNGLGMNYIHKHYDYHKRNIENNYVELGKVKVAMPRIYRDFVYSDEEKAEQVMLVREQMREDRTKKKKRVKKTYPEKDIYWYEEQEKIGRSDRSQNKKLRDVSNNK